MEKIDKFEGEYYFLSNYSPCVIEYEGIVYPSTEHAYQAAKTLDEETRKYISTLATPGLSKKAGRMVDMRPDWNKVKYEVMEQILWTKFSQPEFKQSLLETRGRNLIEGNTWHDNIWGDCFCTKCKDIQGTNWLGKILMEIRLTIMVNEGY